MDERQPSVARVLVPVLAGLVVFVGMLWLLIVLRVLGSDVCPATDPTAVADCERVLWWQVVHAAVSIAFAVCAIVTAVKARTAEMAWKGGIVLLVAAFFSSPLIGFLG